MADFTYMGQRFQFFTEEITDGHNAKSVLTKCASDNKVDMTVVGYHGRKGAKQDPTVMGSAVQFMSINSSTPTMIIKQPIDRKERPDGFSFVICSDGSQKSYQALDLLCRMRHPHDKVTVIICEQHNLDTDQIKRKISEVLENEDCLQFSEILILPNHGMKPKDLIREHLVDIGNIEVDFLFVGNQGADFSKSKDKYLGSVANEMIRHTKFNIVFVI